MGIVSLRRLASLSLLLAAAACGSRSEVVELSPGIYGLTYHASPLATAARRGVEQARAHCEQRGMGFEVVRTQLGAVDYQIAFRCPRPVPELLTSAEADAAPPGFRPMGSLQ